MKHSVRWSLLMYLLGVTTGWSQPPCFEIRYLDFFRLEEMDTLWAEEELDEINKMDLVDQVYRTHPLIPPLVIQLGKYHPDCSAVVSKARYDHLMELYFRIRQQDPDVLKDKTMEQQLEYVRDDFYTQVLNDTLLGHMILTTENGPVFGEVGTETFDLSKASFIEPSFGRIYIVTHGFRRAVVVTNKEGSILWTRIITDAFGEYLLDLSFAQDAIITSTRAVQVNMISQERPLRMYLNTDGTFMFYFSSW